MKMRAFVLLVGAAALAFSAAAAFAQGSAKSKASPTPRTAISIECSKQADAKGLHGKVRHSFRSKCKRDLAKKG
jgi:psiF repeat